MPAGNPAAYNDPIVQQLIERGLLATGGNIRPIPFGSNVASGAASNGSTPSAAAGGVTRNADGTYNVVDENGNEQTVDVTPVAQEMGEDPSTDLSWLAAMIAGGSGALIGSALARSKRDPLAPLDDPKQIGGTVGVEPDARGSSLATVGDDIIEGEFSVVEPKGVTARDTKALSAPQKKLEGATTKQLAERKANARATQVPEVSSIALPDEFADFSPEELAQARKITEQLVMRRQRGNVRAYKPGVKGVGPQHLPTSPGRATETMDQMIGQVARVLRDQKALRSLQKAIK